MGIYEDLGVKPIINALGNATVRGGSIMPPEVVRAMEEAGRTHVRLPELLEKAGARVADLAGVEAAFITSGAAAGIAVAVAGCMTGADLEKMERLPDDTDGMPDEVIVQTRQCYGYDNMIRLAGARTVRAGDENGTTREQVEAAITGRTAAMLCFAAFFTPGDLTVEEMVEIGRSRSIPVIVDAAAEFAFFSDLREYSDMGADLSIFSGGKGLRGPQSSGLVLGRRELIDACALNANPNHGIGRPMKVGKEEIAGLVTAVELFADGEFQETEQQAWRERCALMEETISRLPGVRARTEPAPPTWYPERSGVTPEGVPMTHVEWDRDLVPKTPEEVEREMEEGEPGVKVGTTSAGITLSPHTLRPGDDAIVASRVAEVLSAG